MKICFDDDGIKVEPFTKRNIGFTVFVLTGVIALASIGFAHIVERLF